MLSWFPTTGEFGYLGTFGDYDDHQDIATRLGVHYTHSFEDKQSQPGTNGIENTQIRLTDGNIVFNPDLFGPGIAVESVDYHMTPAYENDPKQLKVVRPEQFYAAPASRPPEGSSQEAVRSSPTRRH